MDSLDLLFLLYFLAAAVPALIARARGLSDATQRQCLIGALLTGWTLYGWAFFLLMAWCESPTVSIRTHLSIRVTGR